MGLSPGDKYYDEPYFYVTPRPYPMENLLDVSRWQAHWHQEDWVGVVLPASRLVHSDFAQAQETTVKTFLFRGVLVFENHRMSPPPSRLNISHIIALFLVELLAGSFVRDIWLLFFGQCYSRPS